MISINKISFSNNQLLYNILFFVFVAVILITRIFLFLEVNIQHVDSDQPFMWLGAKDYSKGLFYEPRFYGQNYNTFMEALFAVPLLWLNVPVYYALPIVTHLLFLFPFFFSAFYLFFNQRKEQGLLVLIILMCMPTAYDMINSMPRGFVTGLFFTSFFVISILEPKNSKFILINGILAVLGFFVNPNSLIVSVPFSVFIFLNNYTERHYYKTLFVCLLVAIGAHLLFNQFYLNHPPYVIHSLQLIFGFNFFVDNISHLDSIFGHIGFFIENNSLLLIFILTTLIVLFYRRYKLLFYAYLTFLGIVLLSFFTSKVNDGTTWPYFSYSRMFLGIPIIIYLFASALEIRKDLIIILTVLAIGFSIHKVLNMNQQIAKHTHPSRWLLLRLLSLEEALHLMDVYKNKCKEQGVNRFIVSNAFWLSSFLNYGGPACYEDFPNTQETNSERRFWVREGNKNKITSDFLYLSTDYELHKKISSNTNFEIELLDGYGLFRIKGNKMTTESFINLVKTTENN